MFITGMLSAIDFVTRVATETWPGIYRFTRDGLVICFSNTSKTRPSEFRTRANSGQIMMLTSWFNRSGTCGTRQLLRWRPARQRPPSWLGWHATAASRSLSSRKMQKRARRLCPSARLVWLSI
jgi:hypothetical protein